MYGYIDFQFSSSVTFKAF